MFKPEKILRVRILHGQNSKSHSEMNEELVVTRCRSFDDLSSQLKIQWRLPKSYAYYNINGLKLTTEDFDSLLHQELIYASPDYKPFLVPNYLDDYKTLKILGKGAFGVVFKAQHKYVGDVRAIKVVRGQDLDSAQDFAKLYQEVKVMSELDHKGIVKLYGSFSYQNHIIIIMEYLEGKNLKEWLHSLSSNQCISESTAKLIIIQLIEAIEYCHEKKYVHRDLKLNNVMVINEDKSNPVVKLIDFGISRKYCEVSKAGTLTYLPPEIVNETCLESSPANDMWALGVILYRLVLGSFPFTGHNSEEMKRQIVEKDIEDDEHDKISKRCWSLIKRLLDKNRETRIKLAEVSEHPWIKDNKPDTLIEEEFINTKSTDKNVKKLVLPDDLKEKIQEKLVITRRAIRQLIKAKSTSLTPMRVLSSKRIWRSPLNSKKYHSNNKDSTRGSVEKVGVKISQSNYNKRISSDLISARASRRRIICDSKRLPSLNRGSNSLAILKKRKLIFKK